MFVFFLVLLLCCIYNVLLPFCGEYKKLSKSKTH